MLQGFNNKTKTTKQQQKEKKTKSQPTQNLQPTVTQEEERKQRISRLAPLEQKNWLSVSFRLGPTDFKGKINKRTKNIFRNLLVQGLALWCSS